MPLPKSNKPIYELEVPSNKQKIHYRQMIVADEKILLMAKTSEDETDIYKAVRQVVNNCIFDVDIDELTTFDIEYLFLKIRSASIGNLIELEYLDREDEQKYSFVVNLEEVEVIFPEESSPLIQIDDDITLKLRYPPSGLLEDERALSVSKDSYEFIASQCIEKIFEGDEVYETDDVTDGELLQYILELDIQSYSKVRDFLSNTPRLHYEISYTNSKGTERKFSLSTLTDFFTLR